MRGRGPYCDLHRGQVAKGKQPTPKMVPRTGCDAEGCDRPHHAHGLCDRHSAMMRTHGRTEYLPVKSDLERFWEKVNKTEFGCWEWAARLFSNGYGQFQAECSYGYRPYPAHRWIFSKLNGEIPEGLVVRHRCDNRKCVNPDHLELGTVQDNANDAVTRKRTTQGSRSAQAKLTEGQVIEIRRLLATGINQTAVAKSFGVTSRCVSNIARRQTWRHV
ncbi:HNH endonuclease [Gordonia cholesterolivorans]|uniref:HNH nuclease domain-containing protein n=1 Tax=Gordonia cholesterolivorans TaxID=559625 RepID=A0ABN3I5Q4_9ACTN